MTRLLIYGEHNSGKTHLLKKILEETEQFILIDSTCEEGNKSIINQSPELFDMIIMPMDLKDILMKKPKRCGIDVSWNLERYLENHSAKYLRQFLIEVRDISSFLNANKSLSERYALGLDEIPLFPSILENIALYHIIATGDLSIVNYSYISTYFEKKFTRQTNREPNKNRILSYDDKVSFSKYVKFRKEQDNILMCNCNCIVEANNLKINEGCYYE